MTVSRRQYIDTDEDYWANATTGIHNALDYGAAGNGVTDDITALQEAADAAADADETLYIPDGDYIISDTLTIKGHCSVGPAAELQYTGSGTAVVVGTTTNITGKKICLPRVVKATLEHGIDIGVQIGQVGTSTICVPHIEDFGIGLKLTGANSGGAVYNTFHLGWLNNNKINLDLSPATGCYTNQNLFVGGRCQMDADNGDEVAGFIQVRINDADVYAPNNNTFTGLSLEGDTPQYHILCYGRNNLWLNCRFETTTGDSIYPKVHWGKGTVQAGYNQIYYGTTTQYMVQTADAGNTYNNNSVVTNSWHQYDGAGNPLIRLMAQSSDAYKVLGVYPRTSGGFAGLASLDLWTMMVSPNTTEVKATADTTARMQITNATGAMKWGDGTTQDTATFGRYGANIVGVANGALRCPGTWAQPLLLGSYRLWVCVTAPNAGKLLIKSGAPSSDTDGSVVGAQTAG